MYYNNNSNPKAVYCHIKNIDGLLFVFKKKGLLLCQKGIKI